jgi:phosphatidylserine decarboxylase precursor-related protein
LKIRREGLPFIIGSGLISLAVCLTRVGIFGLAPVLFVLWFFRDPERSVPVGDEFVLSPADGRVLSVTPTEDGRVGACTKVAIFMSVFNVHVNRAVVERQDHRLKIQPGKSPQWRTWARRPMPTSAMATNIENGDGVYRVVAPGGRSHRDRRNCILPGGRQTWSAGERIGPTSGSAPCGMLSSRQRIKVWRQ